MNRRYRGEAVRILASNEAVWRVTPARHPSPPQQVQIATLGAGNGPVLPSAGANTTMNDLRPRAAPASSSFKRLGAALVFAAALALTVASGPAAAQNPSRYEQTDIEYGARLFGMHCIACHGENGDLVPQVNLRSGEFPRSPSDRDLGDNIKNGLPGTAMVPTGYTDSEITALVAYVRNIGKVDLGSIKVGDAARGQALFEGKGDCDSCHRVHGRGPRFAPDLSQIGAMRSAAQLERSLLGAPGRLDSDQSSRAHRHARRHRHQRPPSERGPLHGSARR